MLPASPLQRASQRSMLKQRGCGSCQSCSLSPKSCSWATAIHQLSNELVPAFISFHIFFVSVGLAWQAAGLQFAGIEKHRFAKLHGIFTIDAEEPVANGRPHYSTAEGGHLYYVTDLGKWILNGIFSPDKPNSCIEIIRPGAVPVGEAVWRYYDGSKYVDRTLTVSEVST
eukprot:SAG31_NODE_567_length_14028_cov_4.022328_14_plen_170_part_00